MNTTSLTPWQMDAVAAADAAFKAGYEAGRKDALAEIVRAAQAGLAAVPVDVQSAPIPVASPQARQTVQPPPAGRAKPGSVKQVVRTFVLGAASPVTERQLAQLHPEINRSSRYMAFRTLQEEGVIAKQGDAWVPAPKGGGKPGATTPGFFNLHADKEAAGVSEA